MNNNSENKLVVSQAEAEIIATLFNQGISDFQSIIEELDWTAEKNKQLFTYAFDYFDWSDFDFDISFDDYEDYDFSPRIPEENYRSFFQNLPIQFSDDWFDDEWYEDAYQELRVFLIEIDESRKEKGQTYYTLDEARYWLGAIFCALISKPEHLATEIQTLACVSLKKSKKTKFVFEEILNAFDDAFDNYLT